MNVLRAALALLAGGVTALVPAAALAEEGSRALEPPDDAMRVVLYTVAIVGSVLLVAALGWLYEQRRGLHWAFQDPDPVSDHGDGHH